MQAMHQSVQSGMLTHPHAFCVAMTPDAVPRVAGSGALPLAAGAVAAAVGPGSNAEPPVPLVSLARPHVAGPPAGPPHTPTEPVVRMRFPVYGGLAGACIQRHTPSVRAFSACRFTVLVYSPCMQAITGLAACAVTVTAVTF